MRQSQGYDTLIAFGKEATPNTPPASGTYRNWGIINEFEPEINKNHESIRGLGSRTVQINKAGQLEVSSTLNMYLQHPRVFYYALGKVSTTGSAGAWVHSVTTSGRCEELPTFTINENVCVNGTPLINIYTGSKIDTLTISGSAGELVEVEAEVISQNWSDSATAAASYDTSLNEPLSFSDGIVTINGAVVANVTEFEVELANNLEALYTISTGNGATAINEGVLDITGSLTIALTDVTQRGLFKAGNEFSINLRFNDPTSAANYISITLNGAKYDSESMSKSNDDSVEIELDCLFRTVSVVIGSKDTSDLVV